MKILFIENRFRTKFWSEIGQLLQDKGHDILYLIQNHDYEVKGKNNFVIPYPHAMKGNSSNPHNFPLIESDRNINYFNHVGTVHYDYYREKITECIESFRPNIVFGESTAFHELITIDICEEKGIMYLHPSSCRYPTGRFSFYEYNTLVPFGGSGEVMSDEVCNALIKRITERSTKPDYMVIKKPTLNKRIRRLNDLLGHSLSYIKGEHYNTPNPIVKSKIERRKKRIIKEWESLADERKKLLECSNFKVLYPMQMQPEANIDVWGRSHRDQEKTIEELLTNTSEETIIVVKPNPKSKYELTDSLLNLIRENKRIIPVNHCVTMDYVLPRINLVVTVTGTIAIECILGNIPVVTLAKTINNNSGNCLFKSDLSDISQIIMDVRNGRFPTNSIDENITFLNMLNKTSYKGMPYETHLDLENICVCLNAFENVLKLDRNSSEYIESKD